MDGMKQIQDKQFDLAIVDPPYGAGDIKNCTQNKYKTYINNRPNSDYWNELFRISKNQIVCGGNYFTDFLKPSRGWVCWDKKQPNPKYADGEMLWTSFETNTKFFRYMTTNVIEGSKNISNGSKKPNIHPTQKPQALYEWLLMNYAESGNKIIDTHLGSQSSRIAAHKAGLEFVGFELDKDYFDAGNKRFDLYAKQTKLF
jgi:site-specific DNA-methyltransferase (adenine-specific)